MPKKVSSPSRDTINVRRHRYRKQKGIRVVNIPVSETEMSLLAEWNYSDNEPGREMLAKSVRRFLTVMFEKEYYQTKN